MYKQFGDRLRELREEKGMTQEELARVFNTGKASISHYESNRRMPDANDISRYADYFGVSVDYILGRTDKKDSHPNVFINKNIDLIRGKMSYEEMSTDIAKRLEQPLYTKVFDADYLKRVARGYETPSDLKIQTLAIYAQVSFEFFYQDNTIDDLVIAKEEYKKQKELKSKVSEQNNKLEHLSAELVNFVTDPSNLKYLELSKRIKEKGINPDDIVGFNLKY